MKQHTFLLTTMALLALFTAACSSTPSGKLADYPAVTAHFSEQETADLQTLLNLFEEEIGIGADVSPEAKAAGYAVFNKQLISLLDDASTQKTFPLSAQTQTKLLDVLHIGTFRSIWQAGVASFPGTNDASLSVNLHPTGKFMDFLADVGKEYPQLTELHTDITRAGDISPTVAMTIFRNFELLNTQDPRVQLVYVISCLSWGMNWDY